MGSVFRLMCSILTKKIECKQIKTLLEFMYIMIFELYLIYNVYIWFNSYSNFSEIENYLDFKNKYMYLCMYLARGCGTGVPAVSQRDLL